MKEGIYLNYEDLLIEADNNNLITKEKPLAANAGRIKGNRIAINKDIPTQKEKACVLAEELGHFYTSTGDILDLTDTSNRKQEAKARFWAYNHLIGLHGIIACYKANHLLINEMAEYLDVTEKFLKEALECYRSKYGTAVRFDNYIIGFEPRLYVMELFQ
nr:MAG TPA: IrrE protein [Caudoviricetes sp.]